MLRWFTLGLFLLFLPTQLSATHEPTRKRNTAGGLEVTTESILTSRSTDAGPGKAAQKNVTFILGRPDEDNGEGDGDDGNGDDGGSGGDADTRSPEPDGPVIGPNWDGWIHEDETRQPVYSHLTDVFAGNLGKRMNQAMCICVEAPAPGFATAPGYGNNWDQFIHFAMPVTNPAISTLVTLEFDYNHDTEPGRDFLQVEWNHSGVWETLAQYSGTNRDASGVYLVKEVFSQSFFVDPPDYVGPALDEVQMRIRVTSDSYGSDEDGFFPSSGAAIIDNIRVEFNGMEVSVSDFELSEGDWSPGTGNPAGDFAKILPLVSDLDPCYENDSFLFTFIDDGSPEHFTGLTTGGETSINWSYGPGGYVVNHTGGISIGGATPINNIIQSPAFSWDVPGPEDDPKLGALLYFRVWEHLPLANGIFYYWNVRSYDGVAGDWTPWRNHGQAQYSSTSPHHRRQEIDVTTLITANPDSIQIQLGVVDMADVLGLPGGDSTPSPMFDDVGFGKYFIGGPSITAREGDLFQDSYANLGTTDFILTPAAREVRLDMARDINPGTSIIPGDSMVVAVTSPDPAATITQVRVVYAINTSGLFPGTRANPGMVGPLMGMEGDCVAGVPASGFRGWFDATAVTNQFGEAVGNKYFVDFPDGAAHPNAPHQSNEPAFLLAGDVLHYYIEATDSMGGVSTLPADITGFEDFRDCGGYNPDFIVHGLPGIRPDPGPGDYLVPNVVVVQHGGGQEQYEDIRSAFKHNGMIEGIDYDHFRVNSPGSGLSNGLGATGSKGASVDQMNLYSNLFYFGHDTSAFHLSDGSNTGTNDKGDETALLGSWYLHDSDRAIVWFGDNLVSGLLEQGRAILVSGSMGIEFTALDARSIIDDQVAPAISPTDLGTSSGVFTSDLLAGACLGTEQFDAIKPSVGLDRWASHEFQDPSGATPYTIAASVWHDRTITPVATPRRRLDVTFPISFSSFIDPLSKSAGVPDRAQLLGDLLTELGLISGPPVANPPATKWEFRLQGAHPNPFNPRTQIQFTLDQPGDVDLRVFDLRGREVVALVSGSLNAGPHQITWQGTNQSGHPVASGVYLISLRSGARRDVDKVLLLK